LPNHLREIFYCSNLDPDNIHFVNNKSNNNNEYKHDIRFETQRIKQEMNMF